MVAFNEEGCHDNRAQESDIPQLSANISLFFKDTMSFSFLDEPH
jgi:hypothetical protein